MKNKSNNTTDFLLFPSRRALQIQHRFCPSSALPGPCSPDDELHFATPSCLDEDGNQLRVSGTEYPMGTDCSGEEIVVWVIGTEHLL